MTATFTEGLTQTKQLILQGWDEVAAEYAKDRLGVFDIFAKRLLDLLNPPRGKSLLDVGCGSGVVALQASVGTDSPAHVVGCDISAAMVSLAARKAEKQGISNITFRQMDAENLDFPDDAFDTVTCAFSLFQFTNMEKALSEMRRVLKPRGKLGLSNWGPGYFSPIAALQRDLFREFGLKPLLTNPIIFKPNALRKMLEKAGFRAIELLAEEVEIWAEDPVQIWDFNLDMGPFPIMLRQQLSLEQRTQLAGRFIDQVQGLMTENGIKCTFHPLYALAEK